MPAGAHYTVLVVGSGAGGLTAAHYLKESGVGSLCVLEASSQVGGRIYKDLGADFIHGDLHNVTYDFLKKKGVPMRYLFNCVSSKGNEYFVLDKKLHSFRDSDLAKQFSKNSDAMEESYFGRGVSLADALANAGYAKEHWFHKLYSCMICRTYSTVPESMDSFQSEIEADEEEHVGYETYVIDGGFPVLIDLLREGVEVQTGFKATEVHLGDTITVCGSNGQRVSCDRLVMAVPIPVLQSGEIRFSPPLPGWKTEALAAARMGYATKIAVTFSRRFWPENISLLITDHPVLHQIWMQAYSGWRPDSDERKEYCVTVFIVGPESVPIVAGAVVGHDSLMSDSDPNSTQGSTLRFIDYLNDLFGSGEANIARASFKHAVVYNWSQNPFVRGAYTYPAVGTSEESRERVNKPVQGRVFFAGEGVHRVAGGTVHAAMETGEECARLIAESLQKPSKL